ncbi:hypothetical protein TNCV_4251401 [Trichonephila clavipes]|nr:hypothetical protein TNCV_4251401 [Trichonephila clavipes]
MIGHDSQVVNVADSWLACEDPPCGGALLVKSAEVQKPLRWWDRRTAYQLVLVTRPTFKITRPVTNRPHRTIKY